MFGRGRPCVAEFLCSIQEISFYTLLQSLLMTSTIRITILTFTLLLGGAFGQAEPDANYKISPNDKLSVSVFDEPELAVDVAVAADGMVTLPMINQIRVAGKSAHEAQLAIAQSYKSKEYLRNPQVTVTVSYFVQLTVSVLGQVGKPGNIEIPGGQQQIDLLTAIANAGDFKNIAQKKKVKITRKADKHTETHDVKDLMTDGGGGKTIYLYPGDVVFVPQRLF